MQTPDITRVQIIGALVGALYPVLTLLGVDLSAEQKDALDNLVLIGLGLIGGDAVIRYGRSRVPSADAGYDPALDKPAEFKHEPPAAA